MSGIFPQAKMIRPFIVVLAVLGLLVGLYCALGARFPGLVLDWKGSVQPVPSLSRFGFALLFLSVSLGLLTGVLMKPIPKFFAVAFVVGAMGGWILIAVGTALDQRARARSSFTLPHERRIGGAPGEGLAWLFAGIGLFFLGAIVWMFLFHQ